MKKRVLPTARIVFDKNNRATSSKVARPQLGNVSLEIRHQGKRKYFDTSVKVFSDQFDSARSIVKNKYDSAQLNNLLADILLKAREYIARCQEQGIEFTFEGYARFVNARGVVSFLDYMAKRIEERKDITESTKKTHRITLNILKEYGGIVTFDDLTKKNIILFDDYLHARYDSKYTIRDRHKHIKVYINDAIQREIIDKDPYIGIKIARGGNDNIKYLTEEELHRIENLKLSLQSLSKARDLFVFSCYTGLAYADLMAFSADKTTTDEDNVVMIRNRRLKNDSRYIVVLLDKARAILDKYNGELPKLANATYNQYLKSIQELAHIPTKLTTHMGRHTFACLMLNNGVPIEVVAKMMGHQNIQTTQIYAKILGKTVVKEFIRVEELLKNKED